MYSKYTGIILKKHPLGEADELLTIFTRESGKIRVKAVSSRKIQSKLGGHLQTLNEIELETAGKSAHAVGLPVLIAVRTLTLNNYLRENLKKFAYALVGIETLYRLTPDRQKNPDAYRALAHFLKDLEGALDENLEVRKFQLQLLQVTGFGIPDELQGLFQNEAITSLSKESEQAINKFLHNILEREIKSIKYLDSLANSP